MPDNGAQPIGDIKFRKLTNISVVQRAYSRKSAWTASMKPGSLMTYTSPHISDIQGSAYPIAARMKRLHIRDAKRAVQYICI